LGDSIATFQQIAGGPNRNSIADFKYIHNQQIVSLRDASSFHWFLVLATFLWCCKLTAVALPSLPSVVPGELPVAHPTAFAAFEKCHAFDAKEVIE